MEQNVLEESLEYVPTTPFMKKLKDRKVMADNEYNFIKFVTLPYFDLMN